MRMVIALFLAAAALLCTSTISAQRSSVQVRHAEDAGAWKPVEFPANVQSPTFVSTGKQLYIASLVTVTENRLWLLSGGKASVVKHEDGVEFQPKAAPCTIGSRLVVQCQTPKQTAATYLIEDATARPLADAGGKPLVGLVLQMLTGDHPYFMVYDEDGNGRLMKLADGKGIELPLPPGKILPYSRTVVDGACVVAAGSTEDNSLYVYRDDKPAQITGQDGKPIKFTDHVTVWGCGPYVQVEDGSGVNPVFLLDGVVAKRVTFPENISPKFLQRFGDTVLALAGNPDGDDKIYTLTGTLAAIYEPAAKVKVTDHMNVIDCDQFAILIASYFDEQSAWIISGGTLSPLKLLEGYVLTGLIRRSSEWLITYTDYSVTHVARLSEKGEAGGFTGPDGKPELSYSQAISGGPDGIWILEAGKGLKFHE